MNRKERRKKKSNDKVAIYNLTLEQIEKIKRDAVNEAIDKMLVLEMYISLMVLRDEGYGKKRLESFANKHAELLDSMQKDYIDYTDLVNTIEEETGFRYVFEN